MARHGLVVLVVFAITILAAAPLIVTAKQAADTAIDATDPSAATDNLHAQSGLLLRDRKLLAADAIDAADQDRRRPAGGGGGGSRGGGGFGGGSRPGGGEPVTLSAYSFDLVSQDFVSMHMHSGHPVGSRAQGDAAGHTLPLLFQGACMRDMLELSEFRI